MFTHVVCEFDSLQINELDPTSLCQFFEKKDGGERGRMVFLKLQEALHNGINNARKRFDDLSAINRDMEQIWNRIGA
jgi:hypothetical protein